MVREQTESGDALEVALAKIIGSFNERIRENYSLRTAITIDQREIILPLDGYWWPTENGGRTPSNKLAIDDIFLGALENSFDEPNSLEALESGFKYIEGIGKTDILRESDFALGLHKARLIITRK